MANTPWPDDFTRFWLLLIISSLVTGKKRVILRRLLAAVPEEDAEAVERTLQCVGFGVDRVVTP
jgi:hypothetical protein